MGAVLAHQMEDGTERRISYVSRALTPVEKRYLQIDIEALAIVFGVKRYHQYLYGRTFSIYSDHKPLMYLFGENRGIPATASARVQRWALTLSGYCYSIKYCPSKTLEMLMVLADFHYQQHSNTYPNQLRLYYLRKDSIIP